MRECLTSLRLNFTKGQINCQDIRFRPACYCIEAETAPVFHICAAIDIDHGHPRLACQVLW